MQFQQKSRGLHPSISKQVHIILSITNKKETKSKTPRKTWESSHREVLHHNIIIFTSLNTLRTFQTTILKQSFMVTFRLIQEATECLVGLPVKTKQVGFRAMNKISLNAG
jgi:hypothetical protein